MNEAVERQLAQLLGSLDYPMFIVTTAAADDGELSGCLVGFATQSSIHPLRFLACVSVVNHTARVASRAEYLAVHLVPRDQRKIAVLFGHETGDTVDKFTGCAWSPGPGGVPQLEECPVRFVGRILGRIDLGDHTGYELEPVSAEGTADTLGAYLRFKDVDDLDPGHPA